MPVRNLGSGGPEVSALGLGLAALGRPAYINIGHAVDLGRRTSRRALARRTHQMLDLAWSLGLSYVDVARSYGDAERFLGSWLAQPDGARSGLTVGSKWGYIYVADWNMKAEEHEVKVHTRENLDRQYDETRSTLGRHLDLYQIHSATLESGVLSNVSVLQRLAELRSAGVLIGVSVSGARQPEAIRRALEIEFDGRRLFSTVQATWNLLETSAGSALAEAAEAGVGVIVKEAVANGRLAGRDPRVSERIAPGDHTIDAVAIAAALHQPWSSVVLSGASHPDHLRSNFDALKVDGSTLASLPDLAEVPADYWERRSSLAWT